MKKVIVKWQSIARSLTLILIATILFTACRKNETLNQSVAETSNENMLTTEARGLEKTAVTNARNEGMALGFSDNEAARHKSKNIVQIALSNPNLSTLVAAVLKTGLADALANPEATLTVFAPTNAAFSKLPAPFNTAAKIAAISDGAQVDFLRNILLYHVLGAEVSSYQVAYGRSSATTLKAAGSNNDNTIYLSKTFGLIRINGQSDVIWANINASNGVVHVINKVLFFPTKNIAEIAIADPAFSSLVAALVKTDLAGVFTGSGDFTVFAPSNAAFAKLPAPFNNADNINAISDPATISALANILKYHVAGSRYFAWDFGILDKITTLADAPNNKVTTILGYNKGWVKGIGNPGFSQANPADILATNGVIHVVGDVLLPKK